MVSFVPSPKATAAPRERGLERSAPEEQAGRDRGERRGDQVVLGGHASSATTEKVASRPAAQAAPRTSKPRRLEEP